MTLQNLSLAKVCGLTGYGLFFWGLGVAKVRYLGPICYGTSMSRSLTAVSTIPLAYLLVRAAEVVFSLQSEDRMSALAMLVAGPLICDGLVLTFYPSLYENEQLRKINPSAATFFSRAGAAWLLYGAGLCLAIVVLTQ